MVHTGEHLRHVAACFGEGTGGPTKGVAGWLGLHSRAWALPQQLRPLAEASAGLNQPCCIPPWSLIIVYGAWHACPCSVRTPSQHKWTKQDLGTIKTGSAL